MSAYPALLVAALVFVMGIACFYLGHQAKD